MPELPFPYTLPEEGDRTLFKHCIHNVLTGNFSFHTQIKRSLSSAGFVVGRIQKHWFHDVYEISLQRGPAMCDDTENQLRRKIRRALKSESISYDRETFVVSVQGRRVVCAFCYKLGMEGVI
jgi:hypothetical protein